MSEWNSFEFVVDEKPEGMRKLGKHLGRIGLLGVVAVFVILCFALNLPALAVIPLLMLGVILYFWKMFNVELAYSIDAGVMTFSRIRGGNNDKKKIILEVTVRDMQEIAPRSEQTAERLKELDVKQIYVFASHSTAPDQYYAVFEKDGVRSAVYFEATEKALKLLRYYNAATEMTRVSR